MPVSGIVATLSDDAVERGRALERLGEDARLTVGEAAGLRLPIVIDTAGAEEHQRAWDAVEATVGVRFVELVFHDFSDVEEAPVALRLRRKHRKVETHGTT
jgi:hypothetical protein